MAFEVELAALLSPATTAGKTEEAIIGRRNAARQCRGKVDVLSYSESPR